MCELSGGRPKAGLQHLLVLARAKMDVGQARLSQGTHWIIEEPGLGVDQAGVGYSTHCCDLDLEGKPGCSN